MEKVKVKEALKTLSLIKYSATCHPPICVGMFYNDEDVRCNMKMPRVISL